MSEPDYQLMADQINFAMGCSYTAEEVRFMIASVVRRPQKPVIISEIFDGTFGTVRYLAPKQPERVYRVNPRMSSVDMLRQAVHDAENRKGDIR